MSVALSGNGGAFTRFGHLAGLASDLIALAGGTATARVLSGASLQTRGTTLETDAAYSPSVSREMDGHWAIIDAIRGGLSSGFSTVKSKAETLFVRQVDLDASLPSKDLVSALTELIRQMKANADSINGSTVGIGSQTALGSVVGSPVIVLSSKRCDGLKQQTPFAESLRCSITTNSQSGGTARQEGLRVRGAAAITDVWDYRYPAGSGCDVTINLTDAQKNNTGGTKVTGGGFDVFTVTNTPDSWSGVVGTPGTHIFSSGSSDSYSGVNALKLTGDGSALITLTSPALTLLPSTSYAVCLFVKAITAAPAAGVLRVALTDGTSVTSDSQSVANSFTVTLTGTTTTYAAYTGFFRTPATLPAILKLELKTTTAQTNATSVVIDDVALTPTTALYAGGPEVAAFAGAVNPAVGDTWTFAVTNTRGILADYLERFFDLRQKGLIFPYDEAGAETVVDGLVV